MKKFLASGLILAVLAFGALMISAKTTQAYYPYYGYGAGMGANNIASWIVLDGLFNPGGAGAGGAAAGGVGAYDPVSSWIVLDGLFGGPNMYLY